MIVRHCPIRRVTPDDGAHYFFGYYDKCPWNAAGDKLLVHRVPFCDRFPEPGEPAEIGWVDPGAADPEFHQLAVTRAWNWQQGAHLRWWRDPFDAENPGVERVMVNDRDEHGHLIARVLDTGGNEVRRLASPVYAMSADGRSAVTVSFGRLTRCKREYGIPGVDDPNPGDPSPSNDGVWRVDLRAGERELIVPISTLDRIVGPGETAPAGGEREQHVNHLMFAPGGERFCFMHRFMRGDNIQQSRLFTSNLDGSDVRLLFEGMCSHYDWRDGRTILAWAGKRSLLGGAGETKSAKQRVMTTARRTLKPIYYALGKPRILMNKIMKDSYLLIPDEADAKTAEFARGELTTDGHCTYLRGRGETGWVLTDGYPDMKGRQPLFLWDSRANQGAGQGYEVGRYPTVRELDGEIRVDLHPRFNADGREVCIDSAQSGGRAVYVVDTSSIIQD